MKNANHDLIHLRQPNVLPFSASWWCYLGNLGSNIITLVVDLWPCPALPASCRVHTG
jgi:hypothetical protein